MIHIESKELCCGCNACFQVCPKHCISMNEDKEGFLYPCVDVNICIDCHLCEKVCPVINQKEHRTPVGVYAAKNKDEEARMKSSSGGLFILLAEKILSEKGVVFGARFDQNWEVVHDFAEDLKGVVEFQRSKYVQSRVGDSYKNAEEFLKQGKRVLFTGTPCQVAGLRLFLRKEYENLLTVDFVCHGVPSPKVWRMYLKEILNSPKGSVGKNTVLHSLNDLSVIAGISFRDKQFGWKKFGFVVRKSVPLFGTDKNSVLLSEIFSKNLFMRGFLNDLYLRPSCHACPSKCFKSGSDITIGDYWGIQEVLPDFDDDKGVSLIMINTEKGHCIYKALAVESKQTSYAEALKGNPVIEFSCKAPMKRAFFLQQLFQTNCALEVIDNLTRLPLPVRLKCKAKAGVRWLYKKIMR